MAIGPTSSATRYWSRGAYGIQASNGTGCTRRRDARLAKYGASPLFEHHTTSLVFNDPPLHTRVRRAILGALSQRHVAAMEAALVARVDKLLDAMAARRDVDLIEDFAAAIPIEVIGNLL